MKEWGARGEEVTPLACMILFQSKSHATAIGGNVTVPMQTIIIIAQDI